MKKTYSILVLILVLSTSMTAQEVNIVPALKQIELGEIEEARKVLSEFKQSDPNDPSVIFLDAVLTQNGDFALTKYESVYNKYPNSRYADAALYRIFSYYYSLGVYNKAESYLTKLKDEYPKSPYIKAANRTLPDIDESESFVSEPAAPPAQVASPVTQTATKANFTVQAGAFLNLANAKSLKSKIESDGHFCEIKPKEVGGSILNVVLVGRIPDKNEAGKILDYLRTTHKLNGRIVPIN